MTSCGHVLLLVLFVVLPIIEITAGCDSACQKECIQVLNKYRENHDAPRLQFSQFLADKAQKWADGGKFGYDMESRGKYGQLIEWDVKDELPTFTSVIKHWHDKEKDYDFQTGKSKNGKTLHDFTQVVWKKARKAGCARGKMFGSRYYVVWMDADGVMSPNIIGGSENVGAPKREDIHWFEITQISAVGEPLYFNTTNTTQQGNLTRSHISENLSQKLSRFADQENNDVITDLNEVNKEQQVLNNVNNIKAYVHDSLSRVFAEENMEVENLRNAFEDSGNQYSQRDTDVRNVGKAADETVTKNGGDIDKQSAGHVGQRPEGAPDNTLYLQGIRPDQRNPAEENRLEAAPELNGEGRAPEAQKGEENDLLEDGEKQIENEDNMLLNGLTSTLHPRPGNQEESNPPHGFRPRVAGVTKPSQRQERLNSEYDKRVKENTQDVQNSSVSKTVEAGNTSMTESTPTQIIHQEVTPNGVNETDLKDQNKQSNGSSLIKSSPHNPLRRKLFQEKTTQNSTKDFAALIMGKVSPVNNGTVLEGVPNKNYNSIKNDNEIKPDVDTELSNVVNLINTRLKALVKTKDKQGSIPVNGIDVNLNINQEMKDFPQLRQATISMVGKPLRFPLNETKEDLKGKMQELSKTLKGKHWKGKQTEHGQGGDMYHNNGPGDGNGAYSGQPEDSHLNGPETREQQENKNYNDGAMEPHSAAEGGETNSFQSDGPMPEAMAGPQSNGPSSESWNDGPDSAHDSPPGMGNNGMMQNSEMNELHMPLHSHPQEEADWFEGMGSDYPDSPDQMEESADPLSHALNMGPQGLYAYRKKYTSENPNEDKGNFDQHGILEKKGNYKTSSSQSLQPVIAEHRLQQSQAALKPIREPDETESKDEWSENSLPPLMGDDYTASQFAQDNNKRLPGYFNQELDPTEHMQYTEDDRYHYRNGPSFQADTAESNNKQESLPNGEMVQTSNNKENSDSKQSNKEMSNQLLPPGLLPLESARQVKEGSDAESGNSSRIQQEPFPESLSKQDSGKVMKSESNNPTNPSSAPDTPQFPGGAPQVDGGQSNGEYNSSPQMVSPPQGLTPNGPTIEVDGRPIKGPYRTSNVFVSHSPVEFSTATTILVGGNMKGDGTNSQQTMPSPSGQMQNSPTKQDNNSNGKQTSTGGINPTDANTQQTLSTDLGQESQGPTKQVTGGNGKQPPTSSTASGMIPEEIDLQQTMPPVSGPAQERPLTEDIGNKEVQLPTGSLSGEDVPEDVNLSQKPPSAAGAMSKLKRPSKQNTGSAEKHPSDVSRNGKPSTGLSEAVPEDSSSQKRPSSSGRISGESTNVGENGEEEKPSQKPNPSEGPLPATKEPQNNNTKQPGAVPSGPMPNGPTNENAGNEVKQPPDLKGGSSGVSPSGGKSINENGSGSISEEEQQENNESQEKRPSASSEKGQPPVGLPSGREAPPGNEPKQTGKLGPLPNGSPNEGSVDQESKPPNSEVKGGSPSVSSSGKEGSDENSSQQSMPSVPDRLSEGAQENNETQEKRPPAPSEKVGLPTDGETPPNNGSKQTGMPGPLSNGSPKVTTSNQEIQPQKTPQKGESLKVSGEAGNRPQESMQSRPGAISKLPRNEGVENSLGPSTGEAPQNTGSNENTTLESEKQGNDNKGEDSESSSPESKLPGETSGGAGHVPVSSSLESLSEGTPNKGREKQQPVESQKLPVGNQDIGGATGNVNSPTASKGPLSKGPKLVKIESQSPQGPSQMGESAGGSLPSEPIPGENISQQSTPSAQQQKEGSDSQASSPAKAKPITSLPSGESQAQASAPVSESQEKEKNGNTGQQSEPSVGSPSVPQDKRLQQKLATSVASVSTVDTPPSSSQTKQPPAIAVPQGNGNQLKEPNSSPESVLQSSTKVAPPQRVERPSDNKQTKHDNAVIINLRISPQPKIVSSTPILSGAPTGNDTEGPMQKQEASAGTSILDNGGGAVQSVGVPQQAAHLQAQETKVVNVPIQGLHSTSTTTAKSECMNDEDRCSLWAKQGHCRNIVYEEFMKQHCKETCGYCAFPSMALRYEKPQEFHQLFSSNACKDAIEYEFSCPQWRARGYCEKREKEMKRFCKKTCNFCKHKSKSQHTQDDAPPTSAQAQTGSSKEQDSAYAQTGSTKIPTTAHAQKSSSSKQHESAFSQTGAGQPTSAQAQMGSPTGQQNSANAQIGSSSAQPSSGNDQTGYPSGQQISPVKQSISAQAQNGSPSGEQNSASSQTGNTPKQPTSAQAQTGSPSSGHHSAYAQTAKSPEQPTTAQAQSGSPSGPQSFAHASTGSSSNQQGFAMAQTGSPQNQGYAVAQSGHSQQQQGYANAQTGNSKQTSSAQAQTGSNSKQQQNQHNGKSDPATVVAPPNSNLRPAFSLDERVINDSPEYKSSNNQYVVETGDSEEGDEYAEPEIRLPLAAVKNGGKLADGLEKAGKEDVGNTLASFAGKNGLEKGSRLLGSSEIDSFGIDEMNAKENDAIKEFMEGLNPEGSLQINAVTKDNLISKVTESNKKGPKTTVITQGCDQSCQDECLGAINKYRNNHEALPLILDQHLANQAQRWADKKTFGHSQWAQQRRGGEVIAVGSFYTTFTAAIKAWHDEEKDFDWIKGEKKKGGEVKHFTQVIWKKAKRLGCGKAYANGEPYYIVQMDVAAKSSSKTSQKKRDNVGRPEKPDLKWFMESSPYWKDLSTRGRIPRKVHGRIL